MDGNKTGMQWKEMAIIYRHYDIGRTLAAALRRRSIPYQWQGDKKGPYDPQHTSVKIITMHSSKGLEFPLVCVPGIGAPSNNNGETEEEARLLYVAMTRATHELIMTHSNDEPIAQKMQQAMAVLHATMIKGCAIPCRIRRAIAA